jgi:mannose-1-phosphate guanylyltransferase
MAHIPHTYAVIMAGGVGTRFWPMSRSARPKQFLDILGTGKSLIQMTYDRLAQLVPADHILVVTQERYRGLVAEHLPALPAANVLCEPFMRNTAPCIAYANHWIAAHAGENAAKAAMVVAPADHLILDEAGFLEIVRLALDQTRATRQLITLGIRPSRPDTGYGYIQFEDHAEVGEDERIRMVKTFTEKPSLKLAEEFLSSGDFYWNSGIFIWSLSNIQAAFEAHMPDLQALFHEQAAAFGTPSEASAIASIYADCESISIDYGVMEKARNVAVVLSDFGWSDLGTWGSVHEKLPLDDALNGAAGAQLTAFEATGNVVVSDGSSLPSPAHSEGAPSPTTQKLIAVRGLHDFIIVDTADALLICPKSEEQWIKSLVTHLKLERGEPWI